MVGITAMTVLCTVGVGFYFRFLIASLRECRRRRIGYLVRLQPDTIKSAVLERKKIERGVSLPRAA
jgi:hypothetical protein